MREHPARRSFFVARGRTAAKSCKRPQGEIRTLASRILSESVGIFSETYSSICIVFISILCYYFLTDSVYTLWHVRYFL